MTLRVRPRRSTGTAVPGSVRAWSVVGLLVVLMALNYADKLAFGLAANPILDEFRLTDAQYGLANSAFHLPFLVSTLLVGFVGNRLRTTGLLVGIALLWGVAQVSMALATGLAMILFARVLLGASEGPTYPLVNHAAFKWLHDSDRSVASALLSAGGALGVLVGAPALTWLIFEHDWRTAFVVSGLVSVVWCLAWLAVGREGPIDRAVPDPKTRATDATVALEGVRTSYWRTMASGTFIAIALAAFAANWMIATSLAYGPLYLQDVLDMSPDATSDFIVIQQVFTVLVVYVGIGSLIRAMLTRGTPARLARGVLGGVCLVVAGLATVAFVLAPALYVKLGFNICNSVAMIAFPIGGTICGQITPPQQRAGVLGIYAAIYGSAGVIAPAVTGWLAESMGRTAGLNAAFLLMGAMITVIGGVALALTRPERDARRLAHHAAPG